MQRLVRSALIGPIDHIDDLITTSRLARQYEAEGVRDIGPGWRARQPPTPLSKSVNRVICLSVKGCTPGSGLGYVCLIWVDAREKVGSSSSCRSPSAPLRAYKVRKLLQRTNNLALALTFRR
jgi:hypothetical protein